MTKSNIPPGYKQTKIGVLPVEWEVVKLKEISLRVQDGTHFSPQEIGHGNYKYITSKNIRPGYLKLDTVEYISLEEHQKIYSRCDTRYGDILLTKDGASTGAACLNTLDEEISLLSSVAFIRSDPSKAMNRYIYQFITSPRGQNEIISSMAGQAITRITLTKLRNFDIPLPPLPEQQKIATILATWDDATRTLTQLINAKRKQKRGLMQRLLTGEGKEYKFKELLKVVKRNFDWDDDELYDLISVRRRSGGLFHRSSLYGHQIKTKTLRTAREGDFLMSKMQILHGASALTTHEFDGMKISGSYLAVVSADPKVLDIEYLNLLSQTKQFYHKTYISSYGVHIEKMTFDFKTFLKKGVIIPSLTDQRKAVEILTTADREITLLENQLAELKEQKRGLMQRLLTGQVRVNVATA